MRYIILKIKDVERKETMNELIRINYESEQPTVSARDLYDLLSSESGLAGTERFSKWFERYAGYGFQQGIDFSTPNKKVRVQMEGHRTVSREIEDYDLSVDMAKQICMLQRTDKGMEIRQHFLDLEKAWNTPEQVMARALKMAEQSMASLKDRCRFLGGQVVEQQKVIEQLQPKASYYDLILQCKDLIATTIIAKDYGMSAIAFNKMLHEMGIQYQQSGTWVLYAKYQGQGYLKPKTHNYADAAGIQHSREHSYWTQKGRLFLYDLLKQECILPLMERKIA